MATREEKRQIARMLALCETPTLFYELRWGTHFRIGSRLLVKLDESSAETSRGVEIPMLGKTQVFWEGEPF